MSKHEKKMPSASDHNFPQGGHKAAAHTGESVGAAEVASEPFEGVPAGPESIEATLGKIGVPAAFVGSPDMRKIGLALLAIAGAIGPDVREEVRKILGG